MLRLMQFERASVANYGLPSQQRDAIFTVPLEEKGSEKEKDKGMKSGGREMLVGRDARNNQFRRERVKCTVGFGRSCPHLTDGNSSGMFGW